MNGSVTVRFDRLGTDPDTKKHKRPEPDHFTREQAGGQIAETAVAHTVSVVARKLRAGIEGRDLIVRLTTPDGAPSKTVGFQLLDARNRARLGHGLAWATDDQGQRIALGPFTYEQRVTT